MLQSLKKLRITPWTHRPVVNLRWFSDDEKIEKEKVKVEKPKEKSLKNKEAANRLKSLIESMSTVESKTDFKIQTAPKKKPVKIVETTKTHEAKIREVTAAIANKIGGDVQQTESELLQKLLGTTGSKRSESLSELISGMKVEEDEKRKPSKEREFRGDERESYSRADGDRRTFGQVRDDREPYSRADSDRRTFGQVRDDREPYSRADSDRRTFGQGRDDREPYSRADGDRRTFGQARDDSEPYSRANNVRKALGLSRDRTFQRRSDPAPSSGVVNLFGAEPLGFFTKASTAKDPLITWSKLEQRELKLAVTHPPSNYFEKMIMWTDQGKLWKFPIDNEQDIEEKDVDFSEHVLLEMFLEGWCPSMGPVRHFMELVCVGLSNNNFLTAKEKKDHIFWYRDYFEEKKDLLGDLMVMGKVPQPQLEA